MAISIGKQTNYKGGSFIVNYVMLPGYPDYDGGLRGVGITWGDERQFIVAESEHDFWSQFPFNLFTPSNTVCTPTDCGLSASDSLSTPAAISG